MTFGDIVAGELVFVDANTFVYALAQVTLLEQNFGDFRWRLHRKS